MAGPKLETEQIERAAQHLAQARKTGQPVPCMPDEYRPRDSESAIEIQRRVLEIIGAETGGWKCGVPSERTGVIVSPLMKSAIFASSRVATPGTKGLAEPEIAFVLGEDLPYREKPYSPEEVRAAIKESRMVIELIGSRYEDRLSASLPELLADSYSNLGLIVGRPLPSGALDGPIGTLHVKVSTPDRVLFDRESRHPSGHPLHALNWLADFLHERGEGLSAGQIVTTGSYAGIVQCPLNTPLRAELGDLAVFDFELVPQKP